MKLKTPIRVALLATITDYGGIEKVLLNMLQHMDASVALRPILFSRADVNEAAFFDQLEASRIPHVRFVNTRKRRYYNVVKNMRDALAILRDERVDVVHCHGYRADLLGLVAAARYKLPVVSTCHGFIATDRNLQFNVRADFWALKRFNRVIAVSDSIRAILVEQGIDPKRVAVITNAVSLPDADQQLASRQAARAALQLRSDDVLFGYVGRLAEEKGIEQLVEATRRMANAMTGLRVVVVGDGPRRPNIEQRIREANLGGVVTLLGFDKDPARWYPAMDAFVLPSLQEGTPMALLEAMAHGVPVIASAVGGVPAIITHNRNGLLVPPADAQQLMLAMQTLATSRTLRATLGDAGFACVRDSYDVRSWTGKIGSVYHAVVNGRQAN